MIYNLSGSGILPETVGRALHLMSVGRASRPTKDNVDRPEACPTQSHRLEARLRSKHCFGGQACATGKAREAEVHL